MKDNPTHIEIDITFDNNIWNKAPRISKAHIKKTIYQTLADHLPKPQQTEISILLTTDSFIRILNKNYRNLDKPTNVLSFPMTEETDHHEPSITGLHTLGDIIISYETIDKEAQEQGKSFIHHFTHMLVHGCLHLLHYDHQTEEQAKQMEALEIEILKSLDIKNPYATE
ncbi:MAG: rRNA maturation RNase YbeY [Alphaproteobacteria bacterium]